MSDLPLNSRSASPLLSQLAALRRRARGLLALRGIGELIATLLAGILVVTLADYLFHLPGWLRAALLIVGVVGWCGLIRRALIRPLRLKLSDQYLAQQIEAKNPELTDELTSSISFLERSAPAVNALAARTVAKAENAVRSVSVGAVVNPKPAAQMGAAAGAACVVSLLFLLLAPHFSRIGLERLFLPFSSADWPRETHVALLWADGAPPSVWPVGEPLPVRAVVDRGFFSSLRVTLTTESDVQSGTTDIMTLQAAHDPAGHRIFEKIVDPGGSTYLTLRVAAGDDDEQSPIRIRLAPRPEISALTAEIAPPPYVHDPKDPTKPGAVARIDLLTQTGRAVEGSTITLRVSSRKPIREVSPVQTTSAIPQITLVEPNADAALTVPGLTAKFLSPTDIAITFPAKKSIDARILITDTDGFTNRVGGEFGIDVVPDALPTVIITEPRRQVEIVPTGEIPLVIQGNDDLGLTDLILRADSFDAKPSDTPEAPGAIATLPLGWSTLTPDGAGRTESVWNLSDLDLKPGQRLSAYALVRDNFAMPDAHGNLVRHPWVRSAPVTIAIETEEEIREHVRHDLLAVRDGIKTLTDAQTETANQTAALEKTVRAAGAVTPDQKQRFADLAGEEAQHARRASALSVQTESIQTMIRQNHLTQDDLGKLADEVHDGMKQVGEQPMPKAAEDLAGAPAAASAEQAADTAKDAGAKQQEAIATMNHLLDRLGSAGDFAAIRAAVAEILKEQKDLNQRTRETAVKALGLNPEDLPADVKAAMAGIAAEQQKLSDRTRAITAQMDRAATDMAKSDPASSQSLKAASAAAASNQVAPAQSSAADNASSNKISSASNDQAQATRGLEQMMSELDQQNRRQLEELARQVEQLLQAVQAILVKQQALADQTIAAGEKADDTVLAPLGDRQGRLQTNTLTLAAQAEAMRDGRPVAGDLHAASDAMIDASAALEGDHQITAVRPQADAITSLKAAIAKLQKQLDELRKQLNDEDLATIIRKYEAIQKGEIGVKVVSDRLGDHKARRGELPRADLMEAAKQAAAQGTLSDQVAALSSDEKIKTFDVVVWVNSTILDAMATSKVKLGAADVGSDLADAQQESIDRLTDVINALKEEKKKNDFANQGGGGGGGKQPLIPPLAELKLLKAMQGRVNRATVMLNQKIAAPGADKSALDKQVEQVGQAQDKIKTLAEAVVKKLQ
jgi:hypothetical protein